MPVTDDNAKCNQQNLINELETQNVYEFCQVVIYLDGFFCWVIVSIYSLSCSTKMVSKFWNLKYNKVVPLYFFGMVENRCFIFWNKDKGCVTSNHRQEMFFAGISPVSQIFFFNFKTPPNPCHPFYHVYSQLIANTPPPPSIKNAPLGCVPPVEKHWSKVYNSPSSNCKYMPS